VKVWKPKCSCSVTYYNFVSHQFTGLNAIVVPGTLRDSLVLLAVNLEQPTELNPIEIMTDTGAYTDIVFGLFCLLGYRFSPRIADIGGARYWRIDPAADYGCLNGIARHRINTKLIAEHWDDLLRLAGSLKLGVVQATSVMRTLQIGDRPTKLAQAVAELGRIDKTIHALTYIGDEAKGRRILNQLNKGEDRHKLARAVFHGNLMPGNSEKTAISGTAVFQMMIVFLQLLRAPGAKGNGVASIQNTQLKCI